MAVIYLKKFGLKRFLITTVIMNIIFWLSFLPFFRNSSLFFPYGLYIKGILAAQSLPYVTNGAFNFWTLITSFKGIKDTAPFVLSLPYRLWGYILAGLIYLILIIVISKSKKAEKIAVRVMFISALSAFVFLTKMHERYSLIPLVFLLLISLKEKRFMIWFIVLSLVSFLNHYHSWAVPNIKILSAFLANPFIYLSLSLFNVFVLFYFLLYDNFLSFGNSRVRHH